MTTVGGNQLTMPGLTTYSYAEFLASLGMLRILSWHFPAPRLAWSADDGHAVIVDGPDTIDELTQILTNTIRNIPTGHILPDTHTCWPAPGALGDEFDSLKLKIPRDTYPAYARRLNDVDPAAARYWLPALVTPDVMNHKGYCAHSPVIALSGQQTIPTALNGPLAAIRDAPELIGRTLRGDQPIVPMAGGMYLDSCYLENAADSGDGKPHEHDKPTLVWLATQAIPLLRLWPRDTRVLCPTWYAPAGRYAPIAVWTMWNDALTIDEVMLRITHPDLRIRSYRQQQSDTFTKYPLCEVTVSECQKLGLAKLSVAERVPIPGRKFAGPLVQGAVHVVTAQGKKTKRKFASVTPPELAPAKHFIDQIRALGLARQQARHVARKYYGEIVEAATEARELEFPPNVRDMATAANIDRGELSRRITQHRLQQTDSAPQNEVPMHSQQWADELNRILQEQDHPEITAIGGELTAGTQYSLAHSNGGAGNVGVKDDGVDDHNELILISDNSTMGVQYSQYREMWEPIAPHDMRQYLDNNVADNLDTL